MFFKAHFFVILVLVVATVLLLLPTSKWEFSSFHAPTSRAPGDPAYSAISNNGQVIISTFNLTPTVPKDYQRNGNDSTDFKSKVRLSNSIPDDVDSSLATRRDQHPRAKLISISGGRLGNQMFKYAAIFAITRANSSWIPYMEDEIQLQETFSSLSIGQVEYISSLDRFTLEKVTLGASHAAAMNKLRSLRLQDTRVHSFFQSWKFFQNYSDDLRREFKFQPAVEKSARQFLDNVVSSDSRMLESGVVRVGIHVRRDRMLTPVRLRRGTVPCPRSYYQHARDYFQRQYKHVIFIVASADMEWTRANIHGSNVVYSEQSASVDFAILTLCDHVIISVGTYSWWAGWLNRGQTIYYGGKSPNGTVIQLRESIDSRAPPKDKYNDWIPII